MPLIDYVIAHSGTPKASGQGYDYILAADGLYIGAENAYLAARIPIAHCQVRGLAALPPFCHLKHGRIGFALWQHIVDAAQAWAAYEHEVLLIVGHDPQLGYHLVVPRQVTSSTEIAYLPARNVVMEIHSHHVYPAHFSDVDDGDEQRLALYGVLGRLDTERPEVVLRVGVYGYFMPVRWTDVFEGELGDFRDMALEAEEDTDNGVPN
ncbi:MAG: hypothetical protein U0822_08090 [Anaerolineae bacterium]